MKLTNVNPEALRERLRQVREELAELEALEVITSARLAVRRKHHQSPTAAKDKGANRADRPG